MDVTKRNLLKAAAAFALDQWLGQQGLAFDGAAAESPMPKVIIVACGGMRRADTFSLPGLENILHLKALHPQSVFFPFVRNAGVTAHFNIISSILTGNWQRLDDWGKTPPQSRNPVGHCKRASLSGRRSDPARQFRPAVPHQ